jgi:hypothetical protein
MTAGQRRVNVMIQLISHVLPPSSEGACSQRGMEVHRGSDLQDEGNRDSPTYGRGYSNDHRKPRASFDKTIVELDHLFAVDHVF